MTRGAALFSSLLFLVIAPGTLAGLVPYLISGWPRPEPGLIATLGGVMILLGSLLLLECFGRFAILGRGTPAPIAPPERLIVTGAYRRVRNPMYVAVVAIVLGQAALFVDLRLLGYAAVLWTGFHLFVLLYEEPALSRSFPADYAAFTVAVPRWRPRLRPWTGG